MTGEGARDGRTPSTADEEIIYAESGLVASERSDEQRLLEVRLELERGFIELGRIGPAVCVFGSARVPEGAPGYRLAREMGRAIGEAGFTVITGGGPGLMEAANHGAQDAGALSVGLNIELPHEQVHSTNNTILTFSVNGPDPRQFEPTMQPRDA